MHPVPVFGLLVFRQNLSFVRYEMVLNQLRTVLANLKITCLSFVCVLITIWVDKRHHVKVILVKNVGIVANILEELIHKV